MEIAVQDFNNASGNKNKLLLYVSDSAGQPQQASTAVDDLIKHKQVQAIVGLETWLEAASAAAGANNAKVPILSFAPPSVGRPLTSERWPYLVNMGSNISLQIKCIASIVDYYKWSRVIAMYEGQGYTSDSGMLTLLSDELQAVGSDIEHWIVFPSFVSLADPKTYVEVELKKLKGKQSRVFIIVGLSMELASYILLEAKKTGLMGNHSVWITTDTVSNLLDTVNSTVISSMQGIIGTKTHFSDTNPSFLSFSTKFRSMFLSNYPEEDKYEPGVYALQAYDSIFTVGYALEKLTNIDSTNTSSALLKNILSSNFTGLSGKNQFRNGDFSHSTFYEIINVVGKSYSVLKFWSPDYGFSNNVSDKMRTQGVRGAASTIEVVYWPGGLKRVPLGWVMPTDENPMIIGVPQFTSFDKFVNTRPGEEPTGFCIDLFYECVKFLNYDLPHKFVSHYGPYIELLDKVYYKEIDAAVGDITILYNRSKYVQFTQAYAESGLRMVVPLKMERRAWLFTKPFTGILWLVVGSVFVYTIFVVWFLEYRSAPDFQGRWKDQICSAMWFTLLTLFFAHRDSFHNNLTRVVVFIWLCVVFIVMTSYTASLTSMLTVQRLDPRVTDIEALKRSNATVGCKVWNFHSQNYLVDVLHFNRSNIILMNGSHSYSEEFKSGRIKAAFLELPYEKIFLLENCEHYRDTGLKHRFGGLGFAFQQGSPMARGFSEAFLHLSEDGTLDMLDRRWFRPSSHCANSYNDVNDQSLLGLSNFGALFLVTGITSTVMLILHMLTKLRRSSVPYNEESIVEELTSPDWGSSSLEAIPENRETTPLRGIEMEETQVGNSHNRTRPLQIAHSFPRPDRPRIHDFGHVTP
ncbi:hypothetical protein ACHQM5_000965 [Ranunculus cassubicifolius]